MLLLNDRGLRRHLHDDITTVIEMKTNQLMETINRRTTGCSCYCSQ